MSQTHTEKFPRGALIGAAGMIALTLMSAAITRISGTPTQVPASSAIAVRDLLFEDTADGAVNVYDAASNIRPVGIVSPGSSAFLRATMRGLAQQRKRESLSADIPFRLTQWADGRLTLDDQATRRHIELEAFGATNAASFARLLTPESTPQ
jgi:putative photosynthetic complex assembly protein